MRHIERVTIGDKKRMEYQSSLKLNHLKNHFLAKNSRYQTNFSKYKTYKGLRHFGLVNGNGLTNGNRFIHEKGIINGNGLTNGNGFSNGNGVWNNNKGIISADI